MAESNVDIPSLVSLASMKGSVKDAGSESRAKQVARQTASRGFDGFLQTFLDGGKSASKAIGRSGGEKQRTLAHYGKSGAGANMAASDKKTLRRSMEKTTRAEESRDIAVDEDVAAAADEAARMIRDLMFGTPAEEEMIAPDSLQQLADLFHGGKSALGDPIMSGGNLSAWQQAIETANASAEMNGAATLSALDGLLDGLPRNVFEQALARSLGLDSSEGLFNQLAAALDAEVVSVGGGEAGMLAWLGGSAGMAAAAAGNAAANAAGQPEVRQLFTEFLQETLGDSPINNLGSLEDLSGDELVAAFEKWLGTNGKDAPTSGLSGDINKFVQSLANHLRGESPQATAGSVAEFLGVPLAGNGESGTGGAAAIGEAGEVQPVSEGLRKLAGSVSTDNDDRGGQGHGAGQGFPAPAGQTGQAVETGGTGNVNQPATSMSSMMDQLENIERLAEAMRMASRGGIKNLTMQLTPDELGKVMLRVEARDGVVSAYLRVEKPDAAAQLANNLQQLRENLKAQGIELGELDIRTQGEYGALGEPGDGGGRQRDWNSRGGASRHDDEAAIAGATLPVPDEDPAGAAGPGELNLFA